MQHCVNVVRHGHLEVENWKEDVGEGQADRQADGQHCRHWVEAEHDVLPAAQDLDGEGEADAEKHVEERAAKGRAEPHSGASAFCHRHIRYHVTCTIWKRCFLDSCILVKTFEFTGSDLKITYGVAPCQYCQSKNSVSQTKHDPKCFEKGDKLVGDGVDPHDGDDKAGKGEGGVVGGRGGPGGEGHHQG